MPKNKVSIVTLALWAALATVPKPSEANQFEALLLGQSPVPSFSVPDSLPKGTTVKVDGSTSLEVINQNLKQTFEGKYPDATLSVQYSGTDAALAAVREGKADLAAIGRNLTDAERQGGLSAYALPRQKIAIITGPDNPFRGSITFEQFAKIFRGEITDWSQLGGTPGPIRFVDRPENSDTRRAFQNYEVFRKGTFATGQNAVQLKEDSTAEAIAELGKDGIGYAIANQVIERQDVRIVPMHKVTPDNPSYPFSQPIAYVYKGETPGAALASFLGYASSAPGQAAIAQPQAAEAVATSTTASPDRAATLATATPGTETPSDETPAPTETADGAPSQTATTDAGGGRLPWEWLLIPLGLLGLLLWWLRDKDSEPKSPPALPGTTPDTRAIPPARTDAAVNPPPTSTPDSAAVPPEPPRPPIIIPPRMTTEETIEPVPPTPTDTIEPMPPTPTDTVEPMPPEATAGTINPPPDAIASDGVDAPITEIGGSTVIQPGVADDSPANTGSNLPLAGAIAGGIGLAGAAIANSTADDSVTETAAGMPATPDWEGTPVNPETNLEPTSPGVSDSGDRGSAEPWAIEPDVIEPTPDHWAETVPPPEAAAEPNMAEPTPDHWAETVPPPEAAAEPNMAEPTPDHWAETVPPPEATAEPNMAEPTPDHWAETVPPPEAADSATDWTEDPNVSEPSPDYWAEEPTITPPEAVDRAEEPQVSASTPEGTDMSLSDWGAAAAVGGAAAIGAVAASDYGDPVEADSSVGDAESTDVPSDGVAEPSTYRVFLVPQDLHSAYAYWELPEMEKERLRNAGGQQMGLRLCDVTGIDPEGQEPHSWQHYDCTESTQNWSFYIPEGDRDYSVEVGYLTEDGNWLLAARSHPVRIPNSQAQFAPSDATAPSLQSNDREECRDESLFAASPAVMSSVPVPGSEATNAEVLLPPPGELWAIANIVASIEGATVPGATVTIDGQRVETNADGTFNFPLDLSEGAIERPILIEATDGTETRLLKVQLISRSPFEM